MAAFPITTIRPAMSRREEQVWRDLLESRCGIYFSPRRFYLLHNCLWRGMQVNGIESYSDYYSVVLRSEAEWGRLIDHVVNRETSFFRHIPSFTALATEVFPARLAETAGQAGRPIRLWSAGCSTGEEAYSLAISASELPPGCRFEVLGSDLSGQALSVARSARYGERACATIPPLIKTRHFDRHGSEYEVRPQIRTMVRFEPFNLCDPRTYPAVPQDIIFCQNVLIYFREKVRIEAAANLGARLCPGGFLLPADGELAGLEIPGLERAGLRQSPALRRYGAPAPRVF